MTFDNLTDVEFEEFCYDLLNEMGLQKVDWRKGTGKKTSSADSGRDIECEYCRYDAMLQRNITEKWFVECKHYKSGVPFEKLSGAFSWAEAENPDRLIIFVSNFLSNSCKDAIKCYIDKRKPNFKVEIWERLFLEKKANAYPPLLSKHKIEGRDNFLDCLNPIHVKYMKQTPYNSKEQLFWSLEKISSADLIKISGLCLIAYGITSNDFVSFRSINCVNVIKDKINAVAKCISEQFAVQSFVYTALFMLIPHIDITKIDSIILGNEELVQKSIKNKDKIIEGLKQRDPNMDTSFITEEQIIDMMYSKPDDIKNSIADTINLYNSFCDNVLAYLLEHDYSEIIENEEA